MSCFAFVVTKFYVSLYLQACASLALTWKVLLLLFLPCFVCRTWLFCFRTCEVTVYVNVFSQWQKNSLLLARPNKTVSAGSGLRFERGPSLREWVTCGMRLPCRCLLQRWWSWRFGLSQWPCCSCKPYAWCYSRHLRFPTVIATRQLLRRRLGATWARVAVSVASPLCSQYQSQWCAVTGMVQMNSGFL